MPERIEAFLIGASGNAVMSPFSTIALWVPRASHAVTLYAGDTLFFPSFWLHKVICLEDDTLTYNICTLPNEMTPCKRDEGMIYYHRTLGTKLGKYAHYSNVGSILSFGSILHEFTPLAAATLFLLRGIGNSTAAIIGVCVVFAVTYALERNMDNTHGTLTATFFPITACIVLNEVSRCAATQTFPGLWSQG